MNSRNFKLSEFTASKKATEHSINNAPPLEIMENLRYTIDRMQEIRDMVKLPIDITSGYRCPKLNRLVGGAIESDHMKGLGVDFRVRTFTYNDHKVLLEMLQDLPHVRYIKLYVENRLHISFNVI